MYFAVTLRSPVTPTVRGVSICRRTLVVVLNHAWQSEMADMGGSSGSVTTKCYSVAMDGSQMHNSVLQVVPLPPFDQASVPAVCMYMCTCTDIQRGGMVFLRGSVVGWAGLGTGAMTWTLTDGTGEVETVSRINCICEHKVLNVCVDGIPPLMELTETYSRSRVGRWSWKHSPAEGSGGPCWRG